MKLRRYRGITPAIGAMMLLSIALVCAFVLGVFSFGLIGPNTEKVALTTGRLEAGTTTDNVTSFATSNLYFDLDNQGAKCNITSLQLTHNGLNVTISDWSVTTGAQPGNSFFSAGRNLIPAGRTTSYSIYPVQYPALTITIDETYLLTIGLSNGQIITSYLTAE